MLASSWENGGLTVEGDIYRHLYLLSVDCNNLRLEVYTGRKRNTEHVLGERVVKDLSLDFPGKWHIGYFLTTFSHPKNFFVIWEVWASMDVEQPERTAEAFQSN